MKSVRGIHVRGAHSFKCSEKVVLKRLCECDDGMIFKQLGRTDFIYTVYPQDMGV